LVIALLGALATSSEAAASAQQARTAYFQMQVAEAERLAQAAAGDPATEPAERADAERLLARIAWLIDRDAPRALAALDRALATGADACATTLYRVRVLREADRPAAAVAAAADRAGDCAGARADQLIGARAKAELLQAQAASGPARDAALAAAARSLAALSPAVALSADAARVRLALAIERSDGTAALAAWRDYFWLVERNAPESFGIDDAEAARVFDAALGRAPAPADEIGFERLLIRAGFYDEAKRLDALSGLARRAGADPAYGPIRTYFDFRRRFDAATLSFNRAQARGHGDGGAYAKEVGAILADATHALGGSFWPETLGKAYGLKWKLGATAGVESAHIGHVVDDRRLKIAQFGRTGEVRFVSIDNLASNGYQTWLWDGQAATGGWSEGGVIVQVRSSYVSAPLGALLAFQPDAAARAAKDMARFEVQDREALTDGKAVAYLPALQARLAREAREQVAAKARDEAARSGRSYEAAFLKLYSDAVFGHSIEIHEGRHALDQASYRGAAALADAELEYRAKLSELELGEFPRMPMTTIFSPDLAGQTPHGKADTRVMQGFVAWIETHRDAVAGYDPALPAAEQIDRLTDAQVREVARGLDPELAGRKDLR
jgi:hypothetical protein